MITAIAPDPIQLTPGTFASYRTRPGASERHPLPLKTTAAGDGDDVPFVPQGPAAQPSPEPQRYGAGSMFAAAVIAGALPPAPTTIEEVIMRIGSLPIPPESEARLKDLLA